MASEIVSEARNFSRGDAQHTRPPRMCKQDHYKAISKFWYMFALFFCLWTCTAYCVFAIRYDGAFRIQHFTNMMMFSTPRDDASQYKVTEPKLEVFEANVDANKTGKDDA